MHWKYNVVYNSLNFRLTDFQCALVSLNLIKLKIRKNEKKNL